jgi:hypothetical protein
MKNIKQSIRLSIAGIIVLSGWVLLKPTIEYTSEYKLHIVSDPLGLSRPYVIIRGSNKSVNSNYGMFNIRKWPVEGNVRILITAEISLADTIGKNVMLEIIPDKSSCNTSNDFEHEGSINAKRVKSKLQHGMLTFDTTVQNFKDCDHHLIFKMEICRNSKCDMHQLDVLLKKQRKKHFHFARVTDYFYQT